MDLSGIRDEFPALEKKVAGRQVVFADASAGTQMPRAVLERVKWYLTQANSNTGGVFENTVATDRIIQEAREAIACFLGAGPDEVAFGANMTTLCYSLARALGRDLQPGDRVIITDLDHEANRCPWQDLAEKGAEVVSVPLRPGPEARLDEEALLSALTDNTRILAVTLASNAVGTIPSLGEAFRRCREVGATIVADGVHYAPHAPLDVKALGVDFLFCSAYKFFGPHVGAMYGRRDAFDRLRTYRAVPQKETPPQKIETGTLNHEGLAGVGATVEFISSLSGRPEEGFSRDGIAESMERVKQYGTEMADLFMEGLEALGGVTVYGPSRGEARTATVSFVVDDLHSREVALHLAREGIFAWSGHFYATTLLDRLDLLERGGPVRVGFAPYNTRQEVERIVEALGSLGW